MHGLRRRAPAHRQPGTRRTPRPRSLFQGSHPIDVVDWLRPEFKGRENELIHLSKGAALVGVTRAAVSNWARRHAGFPAIVLVTGTDDKPTKWVAREEFLTFAHAQLDKPRTGARRPRARRPAAEIHAARAAHCQAQVTRLTNLEKRQAATLERTRASLRTAQANLALATTPAAEESEAGQEPAAA